MDPATTDISKSKDEVESATTEVSKSKDGVESATISTSDANQMAESGAINDMLPKTGVETHLVFWMFGLVFSFIAFVLSLVFWKRQKKKIN
ncbi:MAG: LPXTG cell wall anchor domain-containing protein [Clostridia bacterium]|jgi:LPXTG-motif cell wall-anchored protein|nr:LPXTG cell wall anchor domain-containing protein [Clostridia bacterium]MCI2000568.1 LPXTG cell wall anchor domain-containing protein [Clostridia bacterium]MCI2015024.1 LPXTG cell wall anchor domain-containing protein [Clostridia bacterium]